MEKIEMTTQQYKAFQKAFDFWNRELFNNALPNVILTFSRHKGAVGFFVPNLWHNTEGLNACEIALNPDYFADRDYKESMSTLVHEMCHLWQEVDGTKSRRNYHNKDFAEKMESVGLITSDTGKEGGKRTGQNMTHYIKSGGKFDKLYDKLPNEAIIPFSAESLLNPSNKKKVKKGKASFTFVCPVCGQEVKAKSETAHLVCGDCMEVMELK